MAASYDRNVWNGNVACDSVEASCLRGAICESYGVKTSGNQWLICAEKAYHHVAENRKLMARNRSQEMWRNG
jgi:hypothetical protein